MSISKLIEGLNDSQRAAVTHAGSHLLVLASAGSGKTRTIIARAGYLIDSGVLSNRIQILTFTRRASREIVERVTAHLGDKAKQLNSSTFHTWCMSLIRKMPNHFGCNGFSIIDREDQVSLFKVLRGKNKIKGVPTAAELCDIYSYARNTRTSLGRSVERINRDLLPHIDSMAIIFKTYEGKKTERNYLDYDDILDTVSTVLRTNEITRNIVANLYDHILVDEMQDTNPLQWELLDALKDHVTLYCVGDDAQSIYGFRGADFRNVHSFSDRVPNSMTMVLQENYRSTQEILDISNWLLGKSPLNYNKKLVAVRGIGYKPKIVNFYSEWEEGRWIAEDLCKRRSEGKEWKEHMILARSAFAARAIEAALLAKEIPYEFIGGTRLLEASHVKDVLSVLRLVVNPHDEIAWMRYLTLWPRVGEVFATKLIGKLFDCISLDAFIDALQGDNKLPQNAISTISKVASLTNNPSEAFFTAKSMLLEILASKYHNQNWEKRQGDFEFVERLARKHSSILEFIEEYILDPVYSTSLEESQNNDHVTVVTIHSAKGTEASVCYVVNVSPGSYPSHFAVGDLDAVEEERRVLYVAMTRAKDELIITRNSGKIWAQNIYSVNGFDHPESYFLNYMPSRLVDEDLTQSFGCNNNGIHGTVAQKRPDVGIIYVDED